MGRIKSVQMLTRQLAAAKAREAALKARATAERKFTGDRRQTQSVQYTSYTTNRKYTLNAPTAGILFFAGSATDLAKLGLEQPQGDDPLARGFKYARIKATVGLDKPVVDKSELSQQSYLRYVPGDGQRKSYSAPISGATPEAVTTRFKNIANAKKEAVKEYGRIWFVAEQPVLIISGDTPQAAPTT